MKHNSRLFAMLLCLLASLLWSEAQAQVTYTARDISADDFTSLGTNGATLTLHFDLEGSPADSPLGSTFSIQVNFSPVLSIDATSRTPLSYDYFFGSLFRVDSSNLQVSDAGIYSAASGVPNPFPTQYTLSVSTGNVPNTPGWTMASDGFGITLAGPSSNTGDGTILAIGGGNVLDAGLQAYGSTIDAELSYLASDSDSVGNVAYFNGNFIGLGLTRSSITFTPVPEPGGALLVMAGGLVLLARRRSRRG